MDNEFKIIAAGGLTKEQFLQQFGLNMIRGMDRNRALAVRNIIKDGLMMWNCIREMCDE